MKNQGKTSLFFVGENVCQSKFPYYTVRKSGLGHIYFLNCFFLEGRNGSSAGCCICSSDSAVDSVG